MNLRTEISCLCRGIFFQDFQFLFRATKKKVKSENLMNTFTEIHFNFPPRLHSFYFWKYLKYPNFPKCFSFSQYWFFPWCKCWESMIEHDSTKRGRADVLREKYHSSKLLLIFHSRAEFRASWTTHTIQDRWIRKHKQFKLFNFISFSSDSMFHSISLRSSLILTL